MKAMAAAAAEVVVAARGPTPCAPIQTSMHAIQLFSGKDIMRIFLESKVTKCDCHIPALQRICSKM